MAKPKVSVERPPEADLQEQQALFRAFMVTVFHFFGGFGPLFEGVRDPRHPAYTTYPLAALLTTGVLLFSLRLGARRQIGFLLRRNGGVAAKFQHLFGIAACPHGDTLNYTFRHLEVAEVQECVTAMTETLIRKKVLYPHRLLDRYFLIVIDGTGMLTFAERHCPHCLTQTHQGRTLYYHPVLEAKLVTPSGWVFSLMTEFIENPEEHPTKQDCELKAFYRLAARLKRRFPRLPICLVLDGLFAGGPTFSLCEAYAWKYIIVLQEEDLPSVHEEFEALTRLEPGHRLRFYTGPASRVRQDFRWMNEICYVDSRKVEHTLSVIDCLETKPTSEEALETTRFKWVTNFHVTDRNVIPLANQGGRLRWKIENEGFNVQKNGGYALEHAYTRDANATKVFYLLLQIAHLLSQLVEHSSLFRRAFPQGVGSAKNIAFRLLEAWRNLRLSREEFRQMLDARVRIRFLPP